MSAPLVNLTLFTDASFCHETKMAAGAYWARDDLARASLSYPLLDASQPHEAEIASACMAILDIVENQRLPVVSGQFTYRLVLVTDCMSVINVLSETHNTKLCDGVRRLVERVMELKKLHGFTLKINHVKAHNGKSNPRSWVNSLCDKEAKDMLKAMKKELKSV